ncbi:glycosyltransferase family 4 protein [Ochrovirga pacifica]|uniref:glycosyltransferase family 4 protein n=1 Tax=Ochrovirga pacifica TaxID=1042376 RepID=UPI000255A4D4|nr:glycosyltransferase family 4 protein [Ochrovirga pacifica]
MRIGMILDKTFPPDPRVENEAVALIQAGHQVFLFCLTYEEEPLEIQILGIHVKRYVSNIFEYKLSALAYTIPVYTLLMAKKIKHFIQTHQLESLHIHDIRIAEAVFTANKNFNLPTVLDLHDNLPEVMQFYPHLQKFPGKYLISPKKWKQKEEAFITKADKVVTVSPEFVSEVISRTNINKDKIVLVPNTIRTSFYQKAAIEQTIVERYQNHFVLLYLGDTHLRRGLQTAIAAVKILQSDIPNLKLVIVGTNTTDPVLKKQVIDLELSDKVDFEGWQNVALFPSYIKASHICLSPLHRSVQHDVAYANKLFQYMSFAKPVLVSDALAQKNLIQKHKAGLVHKDRDITDFVNKTLLLFHNKTLRNELGAHGKAFVTKEFVWEKTSKGLLNLYKTLSK